jgi:hypothetical protein
MTGVGFRGEQGLKSTHLKSALNVAFTLKNVAITSLC